MLVVFEAGKRTYRTEPVVKKDTFTQLQRLVGGSIEGIPHRAPQKAKWTAYANEEGVNEGLPSNFVAFGVLRELGFDLRGQIGMGTWFFFGNVVLLGKNRRALTEAQLVDVAAAYKKYMREMGEEEEEEGVKRPREDDEEDTERVSKVAKM